jgi:hypothetical protein
VLCSIRHAEGTRLLYHFGTPHTLAHTLLTPHSPPVTRHRSPKSNHSRTSEKFSRNPNHSRTYAKTGGGGYPPSNMINRSILEFSPVLSPQLSRQIFRRHALLCALRVLCGESSFFSWVSSPNCRIPAKNAKSANIPPWLSITIVNIVGAPTYCKWFATGASTLKSGPPPSCGGQAEGRALQKKEDCNSRDCSGRNLCVWNRGWQLL